MRTIPLVCLLAVLFRGVAAAHSSRDDWKPGSSFDLDAHLTHSLADAPLTRKEREQIYRLIDNQTVHDSFADEQRDEERKTVMSARVGSIVLAEGGSQQVLVQGPTLFCGGMAIAESRFGHAKGLRNFVLVTVGMGIGSAIFFDGHLHVGRNGLAGELGHTTVEENGKRCSCGNRGCLELCSSGSAILRRVRDELEHGVTSTLMKELDGDLERLSVEAIVAAAKSHDRLSEGVLSEAGMHVGTALASVVNLLNPEKVILTGKVAQAGGEVFLRPLLYNLRQRALPQAVKDLPVVISEIGEEAATLGMIQIAGEEVLRARCAGLNSKRFKPGADRRLREISDSDNQTIAWPKASVPESAKSDSSTIASEEYVDNAATNRERVP
jgi:protein required for attachment to host cells